ncbi:digestive cysteine proteinase 2-like [Pollicipes pollicipes]|uniref:digestive cysteine proteinase 2-like n=1 Tax=Pollicipes pollicipes TaxID=41117 RepID=UPI0018850494|nr:digestive cysteine proteinase 2-like [Pollicipes pollicipes]
MSAGWTIPPVSAVESGLVISDGQLVSLSRQNLLDCVSPPSMAGALEYVHEHGLASEADYPTTGGQGTCRQNAPAAAALDQVHQVTSGDEVGLAAGLLQNPVAVLINAGLASFQVGFSPSVLYSSGIYDDPRCTASGVDHAVLLVGYGTASGTAFWTLANSWGTSWGEAGFMRMKRGDNMCGVASYAAYPTGVHAA